MSESEPLPKTAALDTESLASRDMIVVPEWGKDRPRPGDAGYEAGFDDNPFENGKEIIVKRHGKDGAPDYLEGGWQIVDDDASVKIGKDKYMVGVVVEKTVGDQVLQKSIPLNEVYDFNPRTSEGVGGAEVAPLTETQEDMADEAIEDAVGLKNPEDSIDENARMYSADEIRAAREAALRLADEQPPLTQESLQTMMSGEAPAPKAESSDPLGELTQGLSQDDRMELRSYADAQIGKREAQKAGDGDRSIIEGQYMGQAYKAMSPAAKAIVNQYVALYERL